MRGLFTFLIIAALLAGCAADKSKRTYGEDSGGKVSTQGPSGPPPPASETDWISEKAELRCASNVSCPIQVGLLLFVFPGRNEAGGRKHYPIRKCTAFLVGATHVMSNGHCDNFSRAQGYFITAMNAPGGRQIRKITGVAAKHHTQHPTDPDLDSGRPDSATFSLSAPIEMQPLALAGLHEPYYNKLHGFVVNSGVGADQFVIDQIDCDVRRHEASFPYDLGEHPDVLTIFNCATKRGNSGGPFFAAGSKNVQAINQGAGDPANLAQLVRRRHNRELHNYENRWTVRATNARCLLAPPGSCTVADQETSNQRFLQMQNRAFQARRAPLQFNEWAEVIN